MTPTSLQVTVYRDPERTARVLGARLAARYPERAAGLRVHPPSPVIGAGSANETLVARADGLDDGPTSVVVRVVVPASQVFPGTSVERQAAALRHVAAHGVVPVPTVLDVRLRRRSPRRAADDPGAPAGTGTAGLPELGRRGVRRGHDGRGPAGSLVDGPRHPGPPRRRRRHRPRPARSAARGRGRGGGAGGVPAALPGRHPRGRAARPARRRRPRGARRHRPGPPAARPVVGRRPARQHAVRRHPDFGRAGLGDRLRGRPAVRPRLVADVRPRVSARSARA